MNGASTNTRTSIVAHSPAGRQLLEALAAIEAEFQANAGAALPEGAIVLPALATQGQKVRHHVFDGNRLLEITDRAGNEDSYVCRRACPDGWRPSHHNPAHHMADFQVVAAQDLEHAKVTAVDLHDEHAASRVVVGDKASEHAPIVAQGGGQ